MTSDIDAEEVPETNNVTTLFGETVEVGAFGGNPFKSHENLFDDILEATEKYQGILPVAGVIGVLEIVKTHVLSWSILPE